MKIENALKFAQKELNVENPLKEANILLCAFLQKSREWILTHEKDEIDDIDRFKSWVKRRANFEPIEYITEQVSFYSRDFFIKKGVLIPRPETEILVDLVYQNCKNIKHPKVLEIGTGSGIISIMLTLLSKSINVVATDISKTAIRVARKNAIDFGVDKKIEFKLCSYDEDVVGDFDILVSNPPYISQNTPLDKSLYYEPPKALFGGKKGYEMFENLIDITKKRGINMICCEMGYDQKFPIEKILKKNGAKEYRFYKDLSNLDRGFEAKF